MTLVVSVRIPDGIVLAVDSLSSIRGNLNLMMDMEFKCKNCQTDNKIEHVQLPPVAMPVSTKSYAQKIVRFKDNYGVAFFGNSFVNKKSILSQIKSLEKSIEKDVTGVDMVADKLLYHFQKELQKEVGDLNKIPPKVVPFGFQVVGFDGDTLGKTWIVHTGREGSKTAETELGVTFTGDIALVQKLMSPSPPGGVPTPQPNLLSFSLQDAVDYARFLIRFVADYQKFANMIPTVGGPVDVALVTSYSGFKWIERKHISEMLEE